MDLNSFTHKLNKKIMTNEDLNNKLMEEAKEFYGKYYQPMVWGKEQVLAFIDCFGISRQAKTGTNPIEYCIFRLKAPSSMKAKLQKNNLPQTGEAAVTKLTDGVGIRVICGFLCDVYRVAKAIEGAAQFKVLAIKDYIACPKPNGYRSYHLIVSVNCQGITIPVEIQIRTISQDSWASLEHQMKYKKAITNQRLIQQELKRCADELASTDISMQTIKELINDFKAEQ